MIDLSIIIVHYKTLELTQRCLRELVLKQSWEVILVDNDSQDNAQSIIIQEFPYVKWISNPSNEGFGRANNLGVHHAKGEYILLLNSDMLVASETIQSCLDYFRNNITTGVLGCALKNEDGTHQKSTYNFIGENEEIWRYNLLVDKLKKYRNHTTVRAVMGSFFMVKKSDFITLNGFDPDYFMYCEELDLCDRMATELNKDIVYYQDVVAIHKHGGSSERNWSTRQTWLSRALLVYKRKGLLYYLGYHCIMTFTIFTNFLLGWKIGKEYQQNWKKTVKAYRSNRLMYWKIPFTFTRKQGKGDKLLRSA